MSIPCFDVIAVDPGYSTAAIVKLRIVPGQPWGLSFVRSFGWAPRKTHSYQHGVDVGRAMQRCVAALQTPGIPAVVAYEEFYVGRSAIVARNRGITDGAFLERMRAPAPFMVPPSLHQRVLHPDAKAIDNGRKNEAAYRVHLYTLDNLLGSQIADIERAPFSYFKDDDASWIGSNLHGFPPGKRAWADAKQHALDAAAIAVGIALGCLVSTSTYDFQGNEHLAVRPGQLSVALQVANILGRM